MSIIYCKLLSKSKDFDFMYELRNGSLQVAVKSRCRWCDYVHLNTRTIFALNLVLPKVQEIKVESSNIFKNYSNYFNYAIIESNTNFSIICIISALNYTEIEFLFRPRRSNETILLEKVQSKLSENVIWTSNLSRESSRNNSGDYICRDSNDHENIANISIDIICMRISTFARY